MKFIPKELKWTADVSRGHADWRSNLKNVLSAVIILGLLYVGLGVVADLTANHIPERWEAKLFSWSGEEGAGDSPEFVVAQRVFSQLTAHRRLRPLPYRLVLIDADAPNAIAVPGGGVGVTRGLLARVRNEIGLATVLGHELGHHQARHALKRLGRVILLRGTMALLLGNSGTGVMSASLDLAEFKYSRDQEREADAFGLQIVHETFGRTDGALEFFEMIHHEHDTGESPWHSLAATHPPTPERIEALRNLQRDLSKAAPPD